MDRVGGRGMEKSVSMYVHMRVRVYVCVCGLSGTYDKMEYTVSLMRLV